MSPFELLNINFHMNKYDFLKFVKYISVQSLSHVQLCDPMDISMPGFCVLHHLPALVDTPVHQVGDIIQLSFLCCSLLLLPSIFPGMRVFNESAHPIRWPVSYQALHCAVTTGPLVDRARSHHDRQWEPGNPGSVLAC